MNFSGQLAGVVLIPSVAPPMFSFCVLKCLETLTANTAGKDISSAFNESSRQFVCDGPAHPFEIEQMLREVIYLNKALDINLNNTVIQVS